MWSLAIIAIFSSLCASIRLDHNLSLTWKPADDHGDDKLWSGQLQLTGQKVASGNVFMDFRVATRKPLTISFTFRRDWSSAYCEVVGVSSRGLVASSLRCSVRQDLLLFSFRSDADMSFSFLEMLDPTVKAEIVFSFIRGTYAEAHAYPEVHGRAETCFWLPNSDGVLNPAFADWDSDADADEDEDETQSDADTDDSDSDSDEDAYGRNHYDPDNSYYYDYDSDQDRRWAAAAGERAVLYAHGAGMSAVWGLVFPCVFVLGWKLPVQSQKQTIFHTVLWGIFTLLLVVFWVCAPRGGSSGYYANYDSSLSADLAYHHAAMGHSLLAFTLVLVLAFQSLHWYNLKRPAGSEGRVYLATLLSRALFALVLLFAPLVCFTGWRRHDRHLSYGFIALHLLPLGFVAAGLHFFPKFAHKIFPEGLLSSAKAATFQTDTPESAPVVPRPAAPAPAASGGAAVLARAVRLEAEPAEAGPEAKYRRLVLSGVPGLRTTGQSVTLVLDANKPEESVTLCCVSVTGNGEGTFIVASDASAGLTNDAAVKVTRVSSDVLTLPKTLSETATVVAEGLGIVPVLSMVKHGSTVGQFAGRTLWIFWVVKNLHELILVKELAEAVNHGVDVTVIMEEADPAVIGNLPFRCVVGELNRDNIVENVLDISGSLLVSGPRAFVANLVAFATKQRGFPPAKIFTLNYQ